MVQSKNSEVKFHHNSRFCDNFDSFSWLKLLLIFLYALLEILPDFMSIEIQIMYL